MKVLHIAPTPFFSDRGCHMRVRGIISALNRRSVENILCTYHHGRDVAGIETIRIPRIPGYTKEEAGPSPFKYLADILLFLKVFNVVRTRRPDVIHGHLHEGALLGWGVRTVFFWRNIRLVFDVQGSLVGELEAHGYFRKWKPLRYVFWTMEYLVTRLPDYFVCSSEKSAHILKDEFHVPPSKVELVNDGVDVATSNGDAVSALRERLGLTQDEYMVIYTGALLQSKGLDNLFKILLEAKRRQLDCHFLIVGYPENVLLDFVDAHGMRDYCTVTGRVAFEKLPEYLGAAAVAIEPKEDRSGEASGKLLNYMGASLPVVCFDTLNNRQILGDSGFYATLGDVAGFVDQLEAVSKSSDMGRQQGQLGKARVQRLFSWDVGAEKICAVYQRAA